MNEMREEKEVEYHLLVVFPMVVVIVKLPRLA
jgi:hypothetical protein